MPKKERQKVPSCLEIESVVADMWGYSKNLIVPNISWGAGLHECDLLILRKSGWAVEVEIKISMSDLKKDATKTHAHLSDKIIHLYFAVPDKLIPYLALIPERAGIILISPYTYHHWSKGLRTTFKGEIVRNPASNPKAVKWTEKERMNLGRLGCMRIWSLKKSLIQARQHPFRPSTRSK